MMKKKKIMRMLVRMNQAPRKRNIKIGLTMRMTIMIKTSLHLEKDSSKESDSPIKEIPPPRVPPTSCFIEATSMPIVEWWEYPEIQALYEKNNSINLTTGKPLRCIYLERNLTTPGKSEMVTFDARFK